MNPWRISFICLRIDDQKTLVYFAVHCIRTKCKLLISISANNDELDQEEDWLFCGSNDSPMRTLLSRLFSRAQLTNIMASVVFTDNAFHECMNFKVHFSHLWIYVESEDRLFYVLSSEYRMSLIFFCQISTVSCYFFLQYWPSFILFWRNSDEDLYFPLNIECFCFIFFFQKLCLDSPFEDVNLKIQREAEAPSVEETHRPLHFFNTILWIDK